MKKTDSRSTVQITAQIKTRIAAIAADERGATAIEYALLASAIAAVIALAVIAVGQWLPGAFSPVVGGLP